MSTNNKAPYVDIHTHIECGDRVTVSCVGTHPWSAKSGVELAVVTSETEAIGEIGLDFCCDISPQIQEELFNREVDRAIELNLPIILHAVRSLDKIIAIIKQKSPRAVIVHGFIGSKELMKTALNQGFYISFGESALRSPKTIEALKIIPRDRLFFESDMSQTPIEQIYSKLCCVMGESVDEIRESIYSNYLEIFKEF
ncbi:MAG: TatD family hydrolase [Rikenellaceae bacterium]